MTNPPKGTNQSYMEDRKKIIGTFNEDDLFKYFRDKFVETWKGSGEGEDVDLDDAAKEAWKTLPLSVLEGVITAYKIKVANEEIINKENEKLKAKRKEKREEKKKKQCKNKKCNRKCSICRKNEANSDDDDSKEDRKPCGPDKGCEKRDEKKDPPNAGKKKGGNCKNDNKKGKCGEKKGRRDCADDLEKICGNCSRKSAEQDVDGRIEENQGGREKRKRLQSFERAAVKKAKRSSSSTASSSSCSSDE